MTVPLREQLKNNAFTTLNGAINSSVTSITVTDGSVFPSTGNFRITIGAEILLCTARSTNTLTVTRGYEGTTAASGSNGASVALFLTTGGLSRYVQDNLPLFGFTSAPPLGKLVDTNGSTLFTASDFTWVNQGTASVTDENGTIIMRAPTASGENCRIQKRSAPSPTYSVIAAMQCVAVKDGVNNFGIGFRESSSGKFVVIALNIDGSLGPNCVSVYNFASATSFTSSVQSRVATMMFGGAYIWFKITDNNTNLLFSISVDGVNFVQVASVGRTATMTGGPNEVLWYINNQGSSTFEMLARLSHWSYL
jgi:hypothetical protein